MIFLYKSTWHFKHQGLGFLLDFVALQLLRLQCVVCFLDNVLMMFLPSY